MHLFKMACLPLLVLATSLAGCAATQDDDASSAEATGEDELIGKRISEADHGKTVVVKEGQSFAVELSENPSAGYEWKVTRTDRSLGYPYLSRHFQNLANEAVGGSGTRRMYWKTTSPLGSLLGKHTIELQYARAFEADAPAKTVSITVDIQPAGAANAGVVEIGSPGRFEIKEGQDFRVTLAGPSPTPLTGWKVVSTTRTLGYPAEEKWVQGDGAALQSGSSTFLWHTAAAGPMSVVGEHRVALEIDRGHGDPPTRFDFTVNITR